MTTTLATPPHNVLINATSVRRPLPFPLHAGKHGEDSHREEQRAIESGITLSRWFGREAKRIYAMLAESPGDGKRRKLIGWIDRKGGSVTAREVRQGHRRFKTTDDAEAALDELAKSGVGRWEPISTTSKGGRSSRRFILSTPSTSTKPPESS